jgi:hypothetical protein
VGGDEEAGVKECVECDEQRYEENGKMEGWKDGKMAEWKDRM